MSTTLSKRHLHRAFPDDNVEVHRIEPTPWLPGNQVFQIRTGLYTHEAILDYGATWSRIGLSKIGQRFFAGIRAEDGLDKLAETIATRQHFETERANLTAESGRDKVQQVLGCSKVHANRVLNKLRGGNLRCATFREQILSLLGDGEKKAAEVVAAIEGNPKAINHELVRLANTGEIVKVRWGVYDLPKI